jgi:hypothetical protein
MPEIVEADPAESGRGEALLEIPAPEVVIVERFPFSVTEDPRRNLVLAFREVFRLTPFLERLQFRAAVRVDWLRAQLARPPRRS